MARITTLCFTAQATPAQRRGFERHVGARRFAFNQCVRFVLDASEQKKADPSVEVPTSAFRSWAPSTPGSARRPPERSSWSVRTGRPRSFRDCPGAPRCAPRSFEEAAVDLARARAAYLRAKTARRVGFPGFQKKGRCTESFRIRNKVSKNGTPGITVGGTQPRSITLPVLGTIRVREDTGRLRRRRRSGTDGPRARICHVTVSLRRGRVVLCVTLEAPDLHPAIRHQGPEQGSGQGFVGVDLGLRHALVAATAEGTEVARLAPLRPLERSLTQLRRAGRTASRRPKGSKNRRKANDRLGVIHTRIANRRKDFVHRSSSQLVKTHDRLCLEDLAVTNLVRNRQLAPEHRRRRVGDVPPDGHRQGGLVPNPTADRPPVVPVVSDLFFLWLALGRDVPLRARLSLPTVRLLRWTGTPTRPPTSPPGRTPSRPRHRRPRTPKRGAGSTTPVEGPALATTSVVVKLVREPPEASPAKKQEPALLGVGA